MLERLGKAGADLATLAGLRLELFGVELREQFEAWIRVALLVVAASVLALIGLGFVAVLVTVAYWDSHPLAALGLFAAVFLGAAALCLRALSAAVAGARLAFPETLAEFRRDRAALVPEPAAAPPAPPAEH